MKIRTAILIIPALLVTINLYGQSIEGDYLQLDYLHVQPGEMEQFMEQVQNSWMEVQRDRIDSGEITGWQLYKVRYPGNRDSRYNFLSKTSANSLTAFENSPAPGEAVVTISNPSNSVVVEPMKNVIHSELWNVRNSVAREEGMDPSRFMVFDHMNVKSGREYEYRMFEDEVARPLHENRMELDTMNAWELYELVTPGGIDYGYNFATGNFYNHLAHIEFGFTNELIRANHPEVNLMEFFEAIFSTRDLVESTMWELVLFVK